MSLAVHFIIGITGPDKTVTLWHTNKHLKNFHYTLDRDIKEVYDNWPDGKYTFVAGYQNGYNELGISHVTVETKMES